MPDWTRTSNPQLRRLMLYPIELRTQYYVGVPGLELGTSCSQSRRATSCAIPRNNRAPIISLSRQLSKLNAAIHHFILLLFCDFFLRYYTLGKCIGMVLICYFIYNIFDLILFMSVKRFGVSLEEDVLNSLDKFVRDRHFSNRSQAIGHLVKTHLIEKKWESDQLVAGVIVVAYDHHKRDILSKSTDIQHEYHNVILATQHFHLRHDFCLETIAVKGKASRLIALSDRLIGMKGIKDGKLVMSGAD